MTTARQAPTGPDRPPGQPPTAPGSPNHPFDRTRPAARGTLVRRLAFASLLANIAIVLTGGAVRLTGSGLGCPTWPRCTDGSWTATAEMGLHGAIEYGNRMLGGLVGVIAIAVLVAALRLRPRRPALVWLAAAILLGVAAQGLVGGVSVRTSLNPWVVGAHFLASMVVIALAYLLWQRAPGGRRAPSVRALPRPMRGWAWLTAGVTAVLLVVGTVVTGSGPHAGDADVARNGLDPQALSQAHADLAFLLLGLVVAGRFGLQAVAAPTRVVRATDLLLAAVVGQGLVGLVQSALALPVGLVWLHLLGACLVWLAAVRLVVHAAGSARPDVPATATATGT